MELGRNARRLASSSSSGCSWAAFEETAKGYGMSGREGEKRELGEEAPRGTFAGGRGPEWLCV